MITIEIRPDANHAGGEFAYDLSTLANSFYPDRDCEVVTVDEWNNRKDYPIRITVKKKLLLDTIIDPYSKEKVKKVVYECFSEDTHRVLAWGTLTGMRPAKIAYSLLTELKNRQEAFEVLMDDYLLYQQKAELALDVAANEHLLTDNLNLRDGYSIYIGIPFCPSICEYCTFSSYSVSAYGDRIDDYLKALDKELVFLDTYIHAHRRKRELHSIYIGGGTPTSLDADQLKTLMDMVHKHIPIDESLEFTVEAGRPDSISIDKLKVLKNAEVTRLSINPQSMLTHTLQRLGRTHTVTQVREAYAAAREVGFENINMDLIVGLPEEDEVDFYNTLNQVYDLGPDSITVHTLVIKRASRMRREQMETGGDIRPEDTLIPVLQKGSYDYLKQHGYEPYYMYRQKNTIGSSRNTNQENVAYARLGKECLYNVLIMEELEDILAFGSGGSTKKMFYNPSKLVRVENVKSIDDYINRIDEMIERKRRILDEAIEWESKSEVK